MKIMLTLGPPEKSLGPRGSPDHTLRTAAFTNAALPWGKAAFRHGAGIPPQSNSRMVCGVHAHMCAWGNTQVQEYRGALLDISCY